MEERCERMTPEERERFRERMGERLGFGPSTSESKAAVTEEPDDLKRRAASVSPSV